MNRISTEHFTYVAGLQTLITEASTLQVANAADLGLVVEVQSHKTGTVIVFVYNNADVDAEGDVHGWNYLGTSTDGIQYKMTIIND